MPKLGLLIPTIWGSEVPKTEDLLEFCRRADALGFDSLWVISKLFHRNHLAQRRSRRLFTSASCSLGCSRRRRTAASCRAVVPASEPATTP